mmetsp:Transcript_28905/g.96191  ORF Transcript_28905/g.96191 Transcript_28905/m.96191 type:complete len:281 (+) Transcript_28905:992-1834(+)
MKRLSRKHPACHVQENHGPYHDKQCNALWPHMLSHATHRQEPSSWKRNEQDVHGRNGNAEEKQQRPQGRHQAQTTRMVHQQRRLGPRTPKPCILQRICSSNINNNGSGSNTAGRGRLGSTPDTELDGPSRRQLADGQATSRVIPLAGPLHVELAPRNPAPSLDAGFDVVEQRPHASTVRTPPSERNLARANLINHRPTWDGWPSTSESLNRWSIVQRTSHRMLKWLLMVGTGIPRHQCEHRQRRKNDRKQRECHASITRGLSQRLKQKSPNPSHRVQPYL